MSIEPGAIVMRNGRYGYQARIVRGDYAAKQEFTAVGNDTEKKWNETEYTVHKLSVGTAHRQKNCRNFVQNNT